MKDNMKKARKDLQEALKNIDKTYKVKKRKLYRKEKKDVFFFRFGRFIKSLLNHVLLNWVLLGRILFLVLFILIFGAILIWF